MFSIGLEATLCNRYTLRILASSPHRHVLKVQAHMKHVWVMPRQPVDAVLVVLRGISC